MDYVICVPCITPNKQGRGKWQSHPSKEIQKHAQMESWFLWSIPIEWLFFPQTWVLSTGCHYTGMSLGLGEVVGKRGNEGNQASAQKRTHTHTRVKCPLFPRPKVRLILWSLLRTGSSQFCPLLYSQHPKLFLTENPCWIKMLGEWIDEKRNTEFYWQNVDEQPKINEHLSYI